MARLPFQLEATARGTRARAGRLQTLHGEVTTPRFMPVGTLGTVRGQTIRTLEEAGARILLANTYHLYQKPGLEVFKRFGGIHRFTGWNGPVLTDSGGYQIFSLPGFREIAEEGAVFRPGEGAHPIALSPETSIAAQLAINSDIMMALDVCIPSTSERADALAAMERTHRWAERSLAARGEAPNALFGIVQGACFEDLRRQSARAITSLPFDGFAVGGLAVGESREERETMTALVTEHLPADRPRYLMGVGTPIDLLEAVHRGVDMFDCIIPTAWAQRGAAFTRAGKLDLRRTAYRLSDEPLSRECGCPVCAVHSRGYLHHLVKAREVLAWQLLGTHNLHFYFSLMAELRAAVLEDRFAPLYLELREKLAGGDPESPAQAPTAKRRRPPLPERLGDFEIHANATGSHSIRQVSSGEVMHSVNDPEAEARALYIEQSDLRARVRDGAPLVAWDVGLGAGTNAMAAIREAQAAGGALHLVSFERDLDAFRLAVARPDLFPQARHGGPRALLESGAWVSPDGAIRWELFTGDFARTWRNARAPSLVYFDPFSPKADSELWSLALFRELYDSWRGTDVELYTYSNSTRVRAALLGAGLFVSPGTGTGPKADTTVAMTPEAWKRSGRPLLGDEWLARWRRSTARWPATLTEAEQTAFAEAIQAHPQFALWRAATTISEEVRP